MRFDPPAQRGGATLARLALAVLVLLTSCAYYNTFYTARKRFREAEKQHRLSGLEHPSPAVLDLYRRSIEKSQKVIENYPESKWVDDARYLIGMAHLRREEWDLAEAAFEALLTSHPDTELQPDALFGAGLCQLGRGEWEEGEAALTDVLERYPRFERRAEVVFHLSHGAFKRRQHRRAIQGFTALLSSGGIAERVRADAHRSRGEAYLEVEAPDSALADFEALAKLSSQPERRLEAELRAGECLERLGRLEEALARYERLEREMPGPNHVPRTLLQHGRALGDLGRHEEAIAIYDRVATQFPASSYAAQAYYQIGLIRELHLADLDGARTAYAKVRETSASSEFASLADERRQSLELFGEYRSQLAGDAEEEKKAEAAFLLAELNLFRLRKVEEALEGYREVERQFPRSSFAPRAAFAVAWIQEHELGDSLQAVEWYRHVHEAYPETEQGVHGGVRGGVLDPDSLSILLGRVMAAKAVEDSLAAVERLRAQAAADSAAADSLARVGGGGAADTLGVVSDSLAAVLAEEGVVADSLGSEASFAGSDSLVPSPVRADSLAALRAVDSLQAARRAPRDTVVTREPEMIPGGDRGSRRGRMER